jgi:hypothetical protein
VKLSVRQREALEACVVGWRHPYWERQRTGTAHQRGVARSGARNTLGSLRRLGLVDYSESLGGWHATAAGREQNVET